MQTTPERTLRATFTLRDGIPLFGSAVTSHGRVLVSTPPFLTPQEVARYDDLADAFLRETQAFNEGYEATPLATHVRTVRTLDDGQQHTTEYAIDQPLRQALSPTIPVAEATIPTIPTIPEPISQLSQSSPIKAQSLGLASDLDLRVGDTVTLRVPAWLMRPAPDGKNLASRILEGRITGLTANGLQFDGHATVRDCEWCHRCGKAIQHPASLRVGYGPVCSGKLGIDWSVDGLDEVSIQSLKDRIKRETHVTGMWLPRRSVNVMERTENTATPEEDEQALDLALMKLIQQKNSVASKTLGWIERRYGDWYSLSPVQKQVVLDELAEFPPAQQGTQEARQTATAIAWSVGGTIYVASPYSPENAQISRSIRYGRWSAQAPNPHGGKPGAWTYPASSECASSIRKAWADKGIREDEAFATLADAYQERKEELSDII